MPKGVPNCCPIQKGGRFAPVVVVPQFKKASISDRLLELLVHVAPNKLRFAAENPENRSSLSFLYLYPKKSCRVRSCAPNKKPKSGRFEKSKKVQNVFIFWSPESTEKREKPNRRISLHMKFVKKASAQIAYKIRDLYNCVLKSHTNFRSCF